MLRRIRESIKGNLHFLLMHRHFSPLEGFGWKDLRTAAASEYTNRYREIDNGDCPAHMWMWDGMNGLSICMIDGANLLYIIIPARI